MKTKLLAIVLSLLCLIQPVMAVGMVGVESADETASYIEAEEAAVLAADYSSISNLLFREDFESYTEGQDLAGSSVSYVKDGFNVGAFGALKSSNYTAKGTTFDGRKVVKFTGTSDDYNMVEMTLPHLPLWGEGEYYFSVDYYLGTVEGGTWAHFGAWHTQGGFGQTNVASAVKPGEWNTVTIKYVVTANGGSFDITPYNPAGQAGTAFTNTVVPGFTPGYTTSAKNLAFTYYVDNITWSKGTVEFEPDVEPEPEPEPDVPEVEDGVIVSEDFETAGADFGTANASAFTVNKGGLATKFGNGDVGKGTVTTVDGNKVMVVSDTTGKWNNMGLRFHNLPILNVGTYKLTFKVNRQLTPGFENIKNWSGYHMNWGSSNYNNFTAVNDEEWVTYTETFVVDDNKNITWTRADGVAAPLTYSDAGQTVHFYMVLNGQGTADPCPADKIPLGTTMTWYLDDVSLTYEAPEEPEIVDDNIVLRENFEKAPSTWVYENATFSYDASGASTKATFVNTDRTGASATMSAVVDTATLADTTISANGTKAFMLKNRVNNYKLTGFSIKNLPLTKVGNYELTFKAYAVTDDSWTNFSTFIGGEGGYLGKPVQGEWITHTTSITVEEAGTAKIKTIQGATLELALSNGLLTTPLQIIWLGNNTATEGYYTIYLDDIVLTYEEPAVPAEVSFVDTEGNAFAYTATAEGGEYVLPAAETLGVGYEPSYTYGDETYYAGETVTLEKGTTEVEFVVAKSAVIFKATGADTPDVAVGDAAGATVGGTPKDGAYDCDYSSWGANVIASNLTLGTYGTYTFDFDVIVSDEIEFSVHTMLYNSTSDGDGVTSIKGDVVKKGTNHLTHSVTIYEKDGAPYFKDRTGAEHPLDKSGYFPIARAVAMGTQASGKFLVDNYTISFAATAPEAVDLVSYRPADEDGKGGPNGMRFASFVTDAQIEAATEYGFIVTLKNSITTDGVADYNKVNLNGVTGNRTNSISAVNNDGVKVLAGAAYNDAVNKIYTKDGSIFSNGTVSYQGVFETFFTGVLYGIPAGQEDTIFVARPYIVVDGTFYYGDCVERSYNQVLNAAGNN